MCFKIYDANYFIKQFENNLLRRALNFFLFSMQITS
jgi:hypothetical protein